MNHLHDHPFGKDEDIIRGIQAGGPMAEHAMRDLYIKYRDRILKYCIRLIKRFPDFKGPPEDLMHDAFLVLVQRIESTDTSLQSPFAYWIGISRHLFLNQLRKDERMLLVSEPEEMYSLIPDEEERREAYDHESLDVLKFSFDHLGSRCQEILLLWVERYSMQEIAVRLNLSGAAMARKNKHECFKKLKNLVKTGNKLTRERHL